LKLFFAFIIFLLFSDLLWANSLQSSGVTSKEESRLLITSIIQYVLDNEEEVIEYERANYTIDERVENISKEVVKEMRDKKIQDGFLIGLGSFTVLMSYLTRQHKIELARKSVAASSAFFLAHPKIQSAVLTSLKVGTVSTAFLTAYFWNSKLDDNDTWPAIYLKEFETARDGEIPSFLMLSVEEQVNYLTSGCIDYRATKNRDGCKELERIVDLTSAVRHKLIEYQRDQADSIMYEGL
jgi:hypothetical protein